MRIWRVAAALSGVCLLFSLGAVTRIAIHGSLALPVSNPVDLVGGIFTAGVILIIAATVLGADDL